MKGFKWNVNKVILQTLFSKMTQIFWLKCCYWGFSFKFSSLKTRKNFLRFVQSLHCYATIAKRYFYSDCNTTHKSFLSLISKRTFGLKQEQTDIIGPREATLQNLSSSLICLSSAQGVWLDTSEWLDPFKLLLIKMHLKHFFVS